jgi:hypothetical protein
VPMLSPEKLIRPQKQSESILRSGFSGYDKRDAKFPMNVRHW